MISFHVPLQTFNESNGAQGRFWLQAKRRKAIKHAMSLALAAYVPIQVRFPLVVRMTRHSAGTLDDDGLRSALKSARDAIAKHIGVDDGDVERVHWQYRQQRAARGVHGVTVELVEGARLVEYVEVVQ